MSNACDFRVWRPCHLRLFTGPERVQHTGLEGTQGQCRERRQGSSGGEDEGTRNMFQGRDLRAKYPIFGQYWTRAGPRGPMN